ncbi:MAG: beta-N-acetylhexosaminidase, partial [Gemmatimonadaceae bacterium]|nr:beta-N-acetylhexosaminidase [Gemmatimonadaceae bacterium]
ALVACGPSSAPRTAPTPTPTPAAPAAVTLGEHRLVPMPRSVAASDAAPFALGASTSIVVPTGGGDAARIGAMIGAMLRPPTGFPLPVSTADGAVPRGAIALRLSGSTTLGEEGYDLIVTPDSVRLVAARAAGLFRGVQTLRQLLPAGIEADQSDQRTTNAWTMASGRIVDGPRFAWRGGMLDVARHFFTVDEVKQYVDLLALYKLNVLHLHLSDDQGWRIQIDSWPKLTTIGGSTQVGSGAGGYYSKADYADIVRYASDRFITVVPEIDMPGHINAAIAAYPELGCSKPTTVVRRDMRASGTYTGIRVGWSTLCHDKESTYRFVDDVIREMAQMTPGPYFHVGGDEVEVLTHEQYATFIGRVQAIVTKYGKTMIGWEDIGKAKLAPSAIAHEWRADTALLAYRQGAKLILSPGPKAYLDMKYTPATELGLRWAGYVELRTAYEWDPATYLRGVEERSVLGVEAPLWSETVKNLTAAEYLIMPRLPAIAEVGWSDTAMRDWASFRLRIAAHASRWRMMGVNFYPSPQVDW